MKARVRESINKSEFPFGVIVAVPGAGLILLFQALFKFLCPAKRLFVFSFNVPMKWVWAAVIMSRLIPPPPPLPLLAWTRLA